MTASLCPTNGETSEVVNTASNNTELQVYSFLYLTTFINNEGTVHARNAHIHIRLNLSRQLWFVYNEVKYSTDSSFLTHGYSVGVFVSHRDHSISISAFFCVLIASSLLCAPGGNRLDQSRTSLVDFSREPVRPVYTLDLSFTC